jgi:Rieske Fe-S protein
MTDTSTTTGAPAGPVGGAGSVARRQVLCGALLLGGAAGIGVLASCGGPSSTPGTATSSDPGAPSASPGTPLATLADVPVGGGTIVTTPAGDAVLLVRPVAGTVKAYNPTCPHQGSRVQAPVDGVMTCPSHGSRFRATDGSVVHGPAVRPLREIAVTLTGQRIALA